MYVITLRPCTDIENTITVVYILLHMFLVDYVIWLSVLSSTKPVPECLSPKFGKEKISQSSLQNRDEYTNSYFLRHFWITNLHPSPNVKPYSPGGFRSPADYIDEPIWAFMEKVLFNSIMHRVTWYLESWLVSFSQLMLKKTSWECYHHWYNWLAWFFIMIT